MGATRAWMIRNLLEGQYKNPVRIVAFNTAEGWPRDVTTDIADDTWSMIESSQACDKQERRRHQRRS
jgi:hypothetical protein